MVIVVGQFVGLAPQTRLTLASISIQGHWSIGGIYSRTSALSHATLWKRTIAHLGTLDARGAIIVHITEFVTWRVTWCYHNRIWSGIIVLAYVEEKCFVLNLWYACLSARWTRIWRVRKRKNFRSTFSFGESAEEWVVRRLWCGITAHWQTLNSGSMLQKLCDIIFNGFAVFDWWHWIM